MISNTNENQCMFFAIAAVFVFWFQIHMHTHTICNTQSQTHFHIRIYLFNCPCTAHGQKYIPASSSQRYLTVMKLCSLHRLLTWSNACWLEILSNLRCCCIKFYDRSRHCCHPNPNPSPTHTVTTVPISILELDGSVQHRRQLHVTVTYAIKISQKLLSQSSFSRVLHEFQ